MADVKLGNKTFAGVSGVKLDTTDGGTVTYEAADLTPIVEAIESVGGTVESETVEGVAEAVENLDACIIPWEVIPAEGTDKLGDYITVTVSKTPNVYKSAGYIKLKKGYNKNYLLYPNSVFGNSYDLSNYESDTYCFTSSGPNNQQSVNLVNSNCASRVILPEEYPSHNGATYILCSQAPIALFLSKTAKAPPTSSWMVSTATGIVEQIVKCPMDTEVPYYLNRMTALTVDSMVGVFENLKDISGEETALTLTLGTGNLEKLTEEQMNIARSKGWNLA